MLSQLKFLWDPGSFRGRVKGSGGWGGLGGRVGGRNWPKGSPWACSFVLYCEVSRPLGSLGFCYWTGTKENGQSQKAGASAIPPRDKAIEQAFWPGSKSYAGSTAGRVPFDLYKSSVMALWALFGSTWVQGSNGRQ